MKVEDIRDKLPSNGEYPKRKMGDITHIDIHHSASLTKDYKGIDTIQSFANSHIKKGWAGLGYHYVVPPTDDIVYKTGYASEMRWSVGGNNSYTISVMVIGSFDKEDIAEKQYQKAVDLAKILNVAYNVPAKNIKGHNEYPNQATLCPGFDMDKFRCDVNA